MRQQRSLHCSTVKQHLRRMHITPYHREQQPRRLNIYQHAGLRSSAAARAAGTNILPAAMQSLPTVSNRMASVEKQFLSIVPMSKAAKQCSK